MEKILVIQTAFLGDAILTLPLIQELAKKFPGALIDAVAIPSTANVFEASPFVRKVWVYDKKGKDKSFFRSVVFAKEIKKEKYDGIYSPHRSFRTSLIVLLTGVKNTTGFDNASLSVVYSNRIFYDKKSHEVCRNLMLLDKSYFEGENWKIRPQVNIPESIKQSVDEQAGRLGKKIAAIAPGSVWETKKYPAEYYTEIIEKLSDVGFSIALIGGTEDKNLCERIAEKSGKKALSFAGKFNVISSVYFLSKVKFLISNDSAPTHMAMAAGIPAVTLYLSTVPSFGFYPYLHNSISIGYDNLTCKPCGIHGHNKCPIETFDCAFLLKPEMVLQRIKRFWEES